MGRKHGSILPSRSDSAPERFERLKSWLIDRRTKIRINHLGVEITLGMNERNELTSETTGGNELGLTPPPFTNSLGSPPQGNVSPAGIP